ncbi:MAG TPA: hypothetical protein PK639_03470 [Candidatus Woesebacteria bacterium]|nr:hypothetical protein [Candidatus Woesebacteria bacterium]
MLTISKQRLKKKKWMFDLLKSMPFILSISWMVIAIILWTIANVLMFFGVK